VLERRAAVNDEREVVDVAVPPVLSRLIGLDEGVVGAVEVGGGVPVTGVVTAADVAAGHAHPQVDPPAADAQAVFAAVAARCDLGASLSRLSHLIKRLEARGYVHRQPDPTDGRYTIAILTSAGYHKLVAAAPAHVAAVRALVVDEFTRNELAQLGKLSDRMVTRVDQSEWRQALT
jgi:MarR family